MLRSMYSHLLRLHPEHFRQRFGDEMMSIFDQAAERRQRLSLVLDGFISLLRQWSLRPEYWHETVASARSASDGVPGFYVFGTFVPRTTALVDGAIVGVATIMLVISVMGYVWTHPTYMPVPGRGRARTVPRGKIKLDNHPRLYWPPYQPPIENSTTKPGAESPTKATAPPSTPAASGPMIARSSTPLRVPLPVLRSYVGDYAADSSHDLLISISLADSHLQMSVSDDGTNTLIPISERKFLLNGESERWVEFAPTENGVVRRVDLYERGRHVAARRR